ncbi:MAG: hypothetical protein FJ042_07935, partial [Candidatus Cloacimonetes bacterium]|nr:hypothetical protein [Candidatus Cloacimonadota bacterium]
ESRGFGIQFKDTYLASAGSVRITATMDLTPAEIGLLQSIFPGFATNSPAVRVQTTGNVSSGAYATDRRCWGAEGERPYDWISGAYALIRTDLPARRVFQQQWTRVSATDVFGWQEGANTWQIVDGELFSFFQGSGTYVLGTPLSGQDSVTIPLDAGLEKVFIQSVWLDFRSINLPDWSVRIELNPQLSTLLTDYFNGTPYQISGYTAYAIRFLHQGQEMESLPANQWIESGLATTHTINPASRLFRCYRTAELDHISYKTSAGAYDADHFSSGDGYIYSGISYSGIYLLADDTGNQTQIRIPYLKSNCRIQTGNAEVSWNDPVRRDYTELSINLAPATDLTHPWFNGSPFHLSNVMPLARVDMFSRKTRSDLPAEFHIRLRNTVLDRKIVTFDNARGPAVLMQRSGFPRLKLYATDALSDDNQFQTDDQWVSFYPEFGGDYFAATLTTDEAGRFPLAYYSTMAFNTNDFKVFTDSDATIPPNSIMTVELHDALPDQYSILANQYDLAQASRAIYFSFNDSSLLATVTPRIYWHTTGRAARLLFSESTGVPYRIYPYTDATDLNDWNYTIDRGYVSFLLTMAGAYAMLDDNAPHTQIMAAVMALFIPFHLSLYQSQMTVQQSFIPSALPLGSQVILARVATVPNLPEALYGYRIIFRNPQGNPFNPAFIDNFASDQYPFIYVPIDDPTLIPTARLFFRPVAGADIELTRVQSFSDYFRHEYMIIGNCALCFVNEPGLFIVRQ